MSSELGITGATGNIGGRVAALLTERKAAMRLLVRDRSRSPSLPGC